MSAAGAPATARPAPERSTARRLAPLLALPAAGFAVGVAVHRAPFVVLGPAMAAAVLAVLVVALVRRRRAGARTRRDGEPGSGAPDRGEVPARAGGRVRPLLFFYYGYLPAYAIGDLSVTTVALVLLGLLVAALLLVVAVRASRRRRWALARAAHPGAAVVVGVLVDLAGMRLMQWFRAARVVRPFVTDGPAVLAADADGVVLDRVGRPPRPVHRWAWHDVEVSSRAHPDGALLVLTLLGPPPAVRGRVVPAVRRRFEVTVALRTATLAATVLPTPLAAVDEAVAALLAQRPAGAGAHRSEGATSGVVGPADAATAAVDR